MAEQSVISLSVLLPWLAGDENLTNICLMTDEVPAALTLPVISGVLTLIAAGFTAFAWKDGYRTFPNPLYNCNHCTDCDAPAGECKQYLGLVAVTGNSVFFYCFQHKPVKLLRHIMGTWDAEIS